MQKQYKELFEAGNTLSSFVDRQIEKIAKVEKDMGEFAQMAVLELLEMRIQSMQIREDMQKLSQRAEFHRRHWSMSTTQNVYKHILDLYENEHQKQENNFIYTTQDLPMLAVIDVFVEFLLEMKQYKEASHYAWRELELCQKIYDDDFMEFEVLAFYDLAHAAINQQKLSLAEKQYQKALSFCREQFSTDHALVAKTLEEIAYFYLQTLQDFPQARNFLMEAVHIRQRVLGEGHPLTVASRSMLAIVYQQLHQTELAEEIWKETRPVLQGLGQVIVFNTDTAFLKECAYAIQVLEAQWHAHQASLPGLIATRESTMQHIQTLKNIPAFMGIPREARKLPEKLFQQEHNLRKEEPEQDSVAYLQKLILVEKRYDEVERLTHLFLQHIEAHPDEDSISMVTTIDSLARTCFEQKHYKEAKQLYQTSLHIYETKYGAEHIHATSILSMLANCLVAMEEYQEAEEIGLRLLGLYTWQKRPEEGLALMILGQVCEKQKRYLEAEQYYKRMLNIQEKKWGTEHIALASALDGLIRNSLRLYKFSEAKELYQRAQAIVSAALANSDHDSIKKWKIDLEQDYQKLLREMKRE